MWRPYNWEDYLPLNWDVEFAGKGDAFEAGADAMLKWFWDKGHTKEVADGITGHSIRVFIPEEVECHTQKSN